MFCCEAYLFELLKFNLDWCTTDLGSRASFFLSLWDLVVATPPLMVQMMF